MELSFLEILFVAFIALLVFGPTELIAKAQTLGRFLGKMRTQLNNWKIMASEELDKKILPPDLLSLKQGLSQIKEPVSPTPPQSTEKTIHYVAPAPQTSTVDDSLNHG